MFSTLWKLIKVTLFLFGLAIVLTLIFGERVSPEKTPDQKKTDKGGSSKDLTISAPKPEKKDTVKSAVPSANQQSLILWDPPQRKEIQQTQSGGAPVFEMPDVPNCNDWFVRIPDQQRQFRSSTIVRSRQLKNWSESTCGVSPSNGTAKLICETKSDDTGVTIFFWFNEDGSGGSNRCGGELTLAEQYQQKQAKQSDAEVRRNEIRASGRTLDCSDKRYQAKTFIHLLQDVVAIHDSPKFPPAPDDCPTCWTKTYKVSSSMLGWETSTYLGTVELDLNEKILYSKSPDRTYLEKRVCKEVVAR